MHYDQYLLISAVDKTWISLGLDVDHRTIFQREILSDSEQSCLSEYLKVLTRTCQCSSGGTEDLFCSGKTTVQVQLSHIYEQSLTIQRLSVSSFRDRKPADVYNLVAAMFLR